HRRVSLEKSFHAYRVLGGDRDYHRPRSASASCFEPREIGREIRPVQKQPAATRHRSEHLRWRIRKVSRPLGWDCTERLASNLGSLQRSEARPPISPPHCLHVRRYVVYLQLDRDGGIRRWVFAWLG